MTKLGQDMRRGETVTENGNGEQLEDKEGQRHPYKKIRQERKDDQHHTESIG